MNAPWHDKNDYCDLKHKVQDLVDNGNVVVATPTVQNINTIPFPRYFVVPPSIYQTDVIQWSSINLLWLITRLANQLLLLLKE